MFILASGLALGSCTLFRKREKIPVVETVRTADSPTPVTAARDLADVMATELNLSPEQTTQVREVLNRTVKQANAAKATFAPKSPQLMTELKRINTSSQKELQIVLGPTKFKQLQANQRKMAAEMQQRRQ
ncbi:hypothetical protein BEN47_05230 [Hymenobacter lapidarius]|uniref:Uncharacterized protein n=1 Tax=Hymenobacter lapidarius TaxID=1908237 RepID=A0A1G1STU2_9BACT|nr:hypothetical protein BEN47_05230 [Hymenobacter lapidarius]